MVLICPECCNRIMLTTSDEDMQRICEQARFHHQDHFYPETREHFQLPREYDSDNEVFVRRSLRESRNSKDFRNPEMIYGEVNEVRALRSSSIQRRARNHQKILKKIKLDHGYIPKRKENPKTSRHATRDVKGRFCKKSQQITKNSHSRFACGHCEIKFEKRSSRDDHVKKLHSKRHRLRYFCQCGNGKLIL